MVTSTTVIHFILLKSNGTKFFYKKPFEILDIAANGLLNILKFSQRKKNQEFFLASVQGIKNPLQFPTDEKCLKFQIYIILDTLSWRKNIF